MHFESISYFSDFVISDGDEDDFVPEKKPTAAKPKREAALPWHASAENGVQKDEKKPASKSASKPPAKKAKKATITSESEESEDGE